jgi:hypothetical protein
MTGVNQTLLFPFIMVSVHKYTYPGDYGRWVRKEGMWEFFQSKFSVELAA